MAIDDFEDGPFGRFDEEPDAGAAADSADSEAAHAQLPRLLRHAVVSQSFRPLQRQRLVAEICDLAPDMSERAQAWAAGLADHEGVAFAAAIDHLATERDQPPLRSLADAIRLMSLPANLATLPDLRRVTNALTLAANELPPILPPKTRQQVLTLVLGWSAVAAGSAERQASAYTHALDAAWAIGRVRMHDIRSALDDERALAEAKAEKRTSEQKVSTNAAAAEPPVQPGYVRVARVSPEAMRWTKSKELTTGLDAVLKTDMPLTHVPDLHAVAEKLEVRFPHAKLVIETLLGDLIGSEYVRFRPTIITGPPGAGKTTMIREFCEALGIGYYRVDASESTLRLSQVRIGAGAARNHPTHSRPSRTPATAARALRSTKSTRPARGVNTAACGTPCCPSRSSRPRAT